MQYDVLADVSDSETVPHLSLNVAARREAVIYETSFFARGQRAFKLVLKSIKEEEGGGREDRRRKEKEEERKKKCEKENIKADEKRGSSDANGKIAARVRARGRVDERDRG